MPVVQNKQAKNGGDCLKNQKIECSSLVKSQRQEKHRNKLSLIVSYSDKVHVRKVIHQINSDAREYKRWLKETKDKRLIILD